MEDIIGKLLLKKQPQSDIFQMNDLRYAVYARDDYIFRTAVERHSGNNNFVYVHIEPNSEANDVYYRFKVTMYDASKSPLSFFTVAGAR